MSKICSLRGISAPQLTPFREDGSINYGEYTRLTQFITDAGVHGVFVCGTTGEFVNLTLEERKRLLTAAVEGAGPESCILFNTTAMNLADMKELFDWKRIEKEVRVITPEFQVWKDGKLKTIVVYTKMCRGEMVRFLVKNRIENPEDLKAFSWEGFAWDENRNADCHFQFVL